MGVLVICVLVFTAFCVVYTVFLYCFFYVYLLFVLSALVYGLMPPNDNSIAGSNNNNLKIIIHKRSCVVIGFWANFD